MSKKKKKKPQFKNMKSIIELEKKSTFPKLSDWTKNDYLTQYEYLIKKAAMAWNEKDLSTTDQIEELLKKYLLLKNINPIQYYETVAKVQNPPYYFHHNVPAKPQLTTSSDLECPACLGPLLQKWEKNSYLCTHCNVEYTEEYMQCIVTAKEPMKEPMIVSSNQPLEIKSTHTLEIQQLKLALTTIYQHNRKLQQHNQNLQKHIHDREMRCFNGKKLHKAAKALVGLTFAGDDTPDEEIEEALTTLIDAVFEYEEVPEFTIEDIVEDTSVPHIDPSSQEVTITWTNI